MNQDGKASNGLTDRLKEYVSRTIQIQTLSSPDLQGITNAEAYSYVLLENFKNIGALAEKNRVVISDIIEPVLNSREPLDQESVAAIQKLNENLLDASEIENIDLTLVSLLTDRLLQDADMKGDIDYRISILDKVIENSYMLINMAKRIVSAPGIADLHREKGITALEKLLTYMDKAQFSKLSPESRRIVMTNARYGIGLYDYPESQGGNRTDIQFRMLDNALAFAHDPFYLDAMPGFDWKYQIFRIYEYMSQLDYTFAEPDTVRKAAGYADRFLQLWKSDPDYYKVFCLYEEIEGRRLRIRYLAGIIPVAEYLDKLYGIYQGRNIHDYSKAGFDLNLDFPLDYLRFMDRDDIGEMDMNRTEEIYRAALAYVFHMPKLGLLSVTLEPYSKLLLSFREFPGNISFEEMCIQSFAALHPPTYIHSKMVADITRCLTRNLIRMKPDLFAGVFSWFGLEDLPENRDKLIEFAYHAALCHDFGKLLIIDTIFIYGRKLFDMEFDLIKQHPDVGYILLSSNRSTQKYAEVARGHHVWYDRSRGYPAAFDTSQCPIKVIIDIVAIADCMDAATDSVGRSYNRGKTLADYEQEVISAAGSRYAPWGPELLQDPVTKRDLEYLLGEGRLNLYKDTYTLLASLDSGEEKKSGKQTKKPE